MRAVRLASPTDFPAYLDAVAGLLREGIPPHEAVFEVGPQTDLFGAAAQPATTISGNHRLPEPFVKQVRVSGRHREPSRFALLYRLAWRARKQPGLLQNPADPDVRAVRRLEQAVRRDAHKMKAFVRFKPVGDAADQTFVAWFEPQHHIIDAVAPFFARRFTGMRWSVLSPLGCAHWDGANLRYGPGVEGGTGGDRDAVEALWLTYYASIFNPARLKTRAMQAEMPRRYWHNLPEARLIPDLVRGAQATLHEAAPSPEPPPALPAAVARGPAAGRLAWIGRQLRDCRRCPIGGCATRAVAGEGPPQAQIVLVGEQPGDAEDRSGAPFVGPAGGVLDTALQAAGLPRETLYVTNAVKHFKFRQRGARRLHQRPSNEEIEICRWWLNLELESVAPRIIVALGASAAFALTGDQPDMAAVRGKVIQTGEQRGLVITYHPAAVLRARAAQREVMAHHLARDLATAREAALGKP